MGLGWSSSAFRCARSWSRKSTMYTCIARSLIHTHPSMTSTKCSEFKLMSGSSGLTWEGAAKSNSWWRVERVGQYKMKWAGSSGAVWHSLQVELLCHSSCAETLRCQSPGHHSQPAFWLERLVLVVACRSCKVETEGEVAVANSENTSWETW